MDSAWREREAHQLAAPSTPMPLRPPAAEPVYRPAEPRAAQPSEPLAPRQSQESPAVLFQRGGGEPPAVRVPPRCNGRNPVVKPAASGHGSRLRSPRIPSSPGLVRRLRESAEASLDDISEIAGDQQTLFARLGGKRLQHASGRRLRARLCQRIRSRFGTRQCCRRPELYGLYRRYRGEST